MEKKTRKKSQLSKGFDKFNIIAIVIVVIIILFAVGFGSILQCTGEQE